MRTVRNVVWTLVGLTASASLACSPGVSPTAAPDQTSKTAPPIPVDEREAALKIIDRAIQAHGGADALARTLILERDGVGNFQAANPIQPFADHTLFALPDRANMRLEIGSLKDKILIVVNGKQAWQSANNQTRVMTPEEVEELRQDLHLMWLTRLTPLKSGAVKIGTLPDGKVADRPVVVVRVQADEHPEVHLFFDKESGLLVKAERPALEKGTSFTKEHLFTGHKAFDGVLMPTHEQILSNGNNFCEVTFTIWKFPSKADEVEFVKP